MIDGIGNNNMDFTSVVMIVPAGSLSLARRNSKIDKSSFTSSESNGTTAELYGYFPFTFDASMSKPWEQVNTVSVAATTSFLIPLMLDFAIFYVPKRVYIFDRNQKQQDQQKNDATEREMERQSVLLGLLCLLLKRLLKAL
jgi:hypothetical protein